ncbi:MAG: xanthine dehydrogenase family protein subunit M [Gammaproteobacteria bacterium]|nr:xanthine dehydrogenase family protein subunit M [Gammaproteobacteria bacterium]
MQDFSYQRPAALTAAIEAFEQAEDGRFLAGGQTLLPVMKHRLATPSDLIDLAGISDLEGISIAGSALSIGAMTTHARVASAAEVHDAIPALAKLAGCIGDPHVRNRGTLGGSIANNDPAADYPAAVAGLNATVYTDRRRIAGDDFFTGFFETALEEGELITRVEFPVAAAACYQKFDDPASGYAVVGVFVSRGSQGVRVAVTGATPCVFRMRDLEAALNRKFTPETVSGFCVPEEECNDDLHATAAYRSHLVGVMATRAVAAITDGEM